jgi:hypothetical protein
MTVWAVHYFAHHRPTEFLVCTASPGRKNASGSVFQCRAQIPVLHGKNSNTGRSHRFPPSEHHLFSLAGQLTNNEKLCALAISGEVFARNRPSGPIS